MCVWGVDIRIYFLEDGLFIGELLKGDLVVWLKFDVLLGGDFEILVMMGKGIVELFELVYDELRFCVVDFGLIGNKW